MKIIKATTTLLALSLTHNTYAAESVDSLIKAAQKEGQVYSIGMPDSWANWKDTWVDLKTSHLD